MPLHTADGIRHCESIATFFPFWLVAVLRMMGVVFACGPTK
jgi:hypothetical protein